MYLLLPFPPSENHYRRYVGFMPILSKEGRLYRQKVQAIIREKEIPHIDNDVSISLWIAPPDKRKRDLDNLLKALFDSITDETVRRKGKPDTVVKSIISDDSQIKHYEEFSWLQPIKEGCVLMRIEPYDSKLSSLTECLESILESNIVF
jgi:Holliday junction resolvase RusA-like endonuclease